MARRGRTEATGWVRAEGTDCTRESEASMSKLKLKLIKLGKCWGCSEKTRLQLGGVFICWDCSSKIAHKSREDIIRFDKRFSRQYKRAQAIHTEARRIETYFIANGIYPFTKRAT